jgi:5-deoxy-glucuronate isomerase
VRDHDRPKSLLRRPAAGASRRVSIAPDGATWRYLAFEACRLAAGQAERHASEADEVALVVLGGSLAVRIDGGATFERVGGRPDVWSTTPASIVLIPPGVSFALEALTDAHVALARASARGAARAPRLIDPDAVLVEERGEGQTFRRVHHLLPPSADAERLILFEVYTPGGNWSSFPPHKHDTHDPPGECELEEIYYYRVQPPTGFALQRVYTPDRDLDQALATQDGDLVLVPRGYHVVSATPGHDCYYLNAMAGPERRWAFSVDPDYRQLMNWSSPAAAHSEPR